MRWSWCCLYKIRSEFVIFTSESIRLSDLDLSLQSSSASLISYTHSELLRDHEFFVNPNSSSISSGPRSANSLQSEPRVAELEEEVARLREQLGKAKRVNDAMWETVVKKVVKQGKESSVADDGSVEKDGGRVRKRGRVGGY